MKNNIKTLLMICLFTSFGCESESVDSVLCKPGYCADNGYCVIHDNIPECKCDKGYIADNDALVCRPDKSICENTKSCAGGKCLFDEDNRAYCQCPDGYVADNLLLTCTQQKSDNPNEDPLKDSNVDPQEDPNKDPQEDPNVDPLEDPNDDLVDDPPEEVPPHPETEPGNSHLVETALPSDFGKDCTDNSQCEDNFCDIFLGKKCSKKCQTNDDCQKNSDTEYICRSDGRCAPKEFVTRWKPFETLTIDGTEYKNVVIFPYGNGHCDYTIHYSDGASEEFHKCPTYNTNSDIPQGHIHSFTKLEEDGLVTIKVTGKIEGWTCGAAPNVEPSHYSESLSCDYACVRTVVGMHDCGNKSYCSREVQKKEGNGCNSKSIPLVKSLCENLISVESFGPVKLAPLTFYNATSLKSIKSTDIPDSSKLDSLMFSFYHTDEMDDADIGLWDTSNVTNMRGIFFYALKFNTSIDNWDTSKVTDLRWAFDYAQAFNQPLNHWNTSNVEDMHCLFYWAWNFNQDLNHWDTGKVKDMNFIFEHARKFNGNISTWNTSKLTEMHNMFANARSFNSDIGNWDVSNVTTATRMFWHAAFNSDISKWNVSKLKDAQFMFYWSSFNKPLNDWDVSNVENMESMFDSAGNFNQPLDKWNTSKVKNMTNVFRHAIKFNQDISTWNTSKVYVMGGMFYDARVFNQDIGKWNTSNVKYFGDMFWKAAKFDQDLSNWDVSKAEPLYISKVFYNHLFAASGMSKKNYCKIYANQYWKTIIDAIDAAYPGENKRYEQKLYDCKE